MEDQAGNLLIQLAAKLQLVLLVASNIFYICDAGTTNSAVNFFYEIAGKHQNSSYYLRNGGSIARSLYCFKSLCSLLLARFDKPETNRKSC